MADKVTHSNILAVGFEVATGERGSRTVYIKIPNPRANLTEQQIKNGFNQILQDYILRDDKGGEIVGYVTAYTETQEVIDLDIGVEN